MQAVIGVTMFVSLKAFGKLGAIYLFTYLVSRKCIAYKKISVVISIFSVSLE